MAKPALIVCPHCGAECLATAPACWICRSDPRGDGDVVVAELVRQAPSQRSEWFFGVSTVLVGVLVTLVGLGMFAQQPGLGLLYSIVVAPAIIATLVRSQGRKGADEPATWWFRFRTLLVSLSITVAVVWTLMLAALAALFIACMFNPPNFH